jgi:ComF family protein
MSLFFDLLFPRRCYGCGKIGDYFCQKCQSELFPLSLDPKSQKLSLFKYTDGVQRAITDLKYHFVTDMVKEITCMSAKSIKKNYPRLLKYWQKKEFVITSIPLHWQRFNWRSFNQSSLLAKNIAKKLKLKYLPSLLLKTKNTQSQASFTQKIYRLKNLNHAFILNPPTGGPIPKNIIIFDDVYTTGATLRSAAKILKSHCREIWFLTLAG